MQDPLASAATNRRTFLSLLGVGTAAAVGGGALAGCTAKSGGEGAAVQVDQLDALLPKYQPVTVVKPDIPGTALVPAGYKSYPTALVKGVKEVPGKGSTITTMSPFWGPVPPGPGQNKYLDTINQKLNAKITPNIQDGNTYIDVLNANFGARDVPDLLVIPSWNVSGIPNFSKAADSLFENLTPHLAGDKSTAYPMLMGIPTDAWREGIWNKKLMAVPWPPSGALPWGLFYRADLLTEPLPKTADELYQLGKKITNPDKGVWAFTDILAMVKMVFRVPGHRGGWFKKQDGSVAFQYESDEFKNAITFMRRLFEEKLVHPDVAASKGADTAQLFSGGKVLIAQFGPGGWVPTQTQQQKILPTFKMMPVYPFAHDGGTPLYHSGYGPVFYSFIKKGSTNDKVEEILRVLNWIASPLGTEEYQQVTYGNEGEHFTREGGWPVKGDLANKEIAEQIRFLASSTEPQTLNAEAPWLLEENLKWQNECVKYMLKDPWQGLKLEMPKEVTEIGQPTEDKITDVIRGRRPLSDLPQIVTEWKNGGGDKGREFMAKALADAGR